MFMFRNLYVHATLKSIFLTKPDSRPWQLEIGHHSLLQNKSVFNPQNVDNQFLDVFRDMVTEDLESYRLERLIIPTGSTK